MGGVWNVIVLIPVHCLSIYFSTLVQDPKRKEEGRSPLIVELGNPVDQNIHSCFYIFWPGDISRKAQEIRNLPSAHLSNFYRWLAFKATYL